MILQMEVHILRQGRIAIRPYKNEKGGQLAALPSHKPKVVYPATFNAISKAISFESTISFTG